jgi:hypothetical protein
MTCEGKECQCNAWHVKVRYVKKRNHMACKGKAWQGNAREFMERQGIARKKL